MEQPIVIRNREELIFMLSEAAQLEHMILCEYLFATFSLKHTTEEGLTAEQLLAVKRWERVISAVAGQEMLHLALVNNLLTAVGASPYFGRPNFPQYAKYFPPHVQLALLPFGEQALRHFLYLERPEGMILDDATGFEVTGAALPAVADDEVVPEAQDFATVGHLYRGIEQGLRQLVERHGERRLFIGPARIQASTQYFGWPELITVTDLASAITAIETIVEEGEGARGDWSNAHYGKFLGIMNEYMQMKEQSPTFAPARAVMAAVVRPPADIDDVPLIADPLTAAIADLFNASYEVLLQVLIRFFIHTEETAAELQTLSQVSVKLMFAVIKPLGQLLTTLPVGPQFPGATAGPSFEIYRTGYLLPHRDAAWIVMHERLLELAQDGEQVAGRFTVPPELARVAGSLRHVAAALEQHLDQSG